MIGMEENALFDLRYLQISKPSASGSMRSRIDQVGPMPVQGFQEAASIQEAIRLKTRLLQMKRDEFDDVRLIINNGNTFGQKPFLLLDRVSVFPIIENWAPKEKKNKP